METEKNMIAISSPILLCAPCCNKCPQVGMGANDMVIINDDNTPGVIREVHLTREQMSQFVEKAKSGEFDHLTRA